MGRILRYSFFEEEPKELEEKLERVETIFTKHEKEYRKTVTSFIGYDENEACDCENCKFYKRSRFDDFEDLKHQSKGHDLPSEHCYGKDEMKKDMAEYSSEGKYYEVSVLAMILDKWPEDCKTCRFKYD